MVGREPSRTVQGAEGGLDVIVGLLQGNEEGLVEVVLAGKLLELVKLLLLLSCTSDWRTASNRKN